MKSLFAAILAISSVTSALPAIANSQSKTLLSQSVTSYLSVNTAAPQAANLKEATSHQFAQRSLNIAKQIPTNALGLVFIDVDQRSWQALEQFQLPAQSPILAINKLLNFLGLSEDFSIVKDVQPWLGKELAITFLMNDPDKLEFSVAALSVVQDIPKFEAFIQKLQGVGLPKPKETLYKNIKIREWQLEENSEDDQSVTSRRLNAQNSLTSLLRTKQSPDDQNPNVENESEANENAPPTLLDFSFKRFAIAQLPSGVAVIASDLQTIERMIDTTNASDSLANNQLFLRSLNNPLWNRSLIAGYGDFKELAKISELLAADLPETSDIPGFSRDEYLQGLKYTLGQYSSLDLFTWITPKGIRSQSNSYFSEERSPLPKDNATRDRLLAYLPSNIYGAITSRNLNRQWQWFVEESKLQPSYKIFVEGLRMLTPLIVGSGLNFDIEKDLISWIDGEYALVVFPSDRSPFKEIGIDLTLGALIRTSKPEAANATLDKLTKYLGNFGKGFLQVKKRQVGTTLLTSFEFPDGRERGKTQSVFAYGWRDHQTLIFTLGANTASAFIPVPKTTLAESPDFRDAIADMPQPNFGYFYVNVNAIAKLGAGFFLSELVPNPESPPQPTNPELPAPIKKVIDKLGGAVFVYSETSDRFQSDFFLGLKP